MLRSLVSERRKPIVGGDLHDENQYLRLIQDILDHGELVEGRNGNTKAVFGAAMHFDLQRGTIPLLTTKRVAVKTCFKELLWFIKGCTDNKKLIAEGVHIWDDNGSREFLDSREKRRSNSKYCGRHSLWWCSWEQGRRSQAF